MAVNRNVIVTLALLVFVVVKLPAQQKDQPVEKVILQQKSMRIDSFLLLISRQTRIEFSFNASRIPPSRILRLPKNELTIKECLDVLKQTLHIDHERVGNHIILLEPKTSVARQKPATQSKHNPKPEIRAIKKLPVAADTTSGRRQIHNVVVTQKVMSGPIYRIERGPLLSSTNRLFPERKISPVKAPDPIVAADTTPGRRQIHNVVIQKPKSELSQNKKEPVPLQSSNNGLSSGRKISSVKATGAIKATPSAALTESNWFIRAGIGAGDVLYVNPTVEAGFKEVYGIASFSTNFSYSGIRFGIGTQLSLAEAQIHFQLTAGPLSRLANLTDSLLSVKSSLYQLHVLYDKQLSSRLSVRAGPIFQLMTTRYQLAGHPFPLRGSDKRSDQPFVILKPAYTIFNTYKEGSSSTTKGWIGLEVSLFYRFM